MKELTPLEPPLLLSLLATSGFTPPRHQGSQSVKGVWDFEKRQASTGYTKAAWAKGES